MCLHNGIPSHSHLSRQVDQSGLGLPSRDFYLNKTENEKVSGLPQGRSSHPQPTVLPSLLLPLPPVPPECSHLCRSLKPEGH